MGVMGDLFRKHAIPNPKLVLKTTCCNNGTNEHLSVELVDPLTFVVPEGDSVADLISKLAHPTVVRGKIKIDEYYVNQALDSITSNIYWALEARGDKCQKLYNWYRRYSYYARSNLTFEKLLIDVYRFAFKPSQRFDTEKEPQFIALLEAIRKKMAAEHQWNDDSSTERRRHSRRRRRW